MGVKDLKAAWNAQVDRANDWDELGLDEIVHFAQQQEREACALACENEALTRPSDSEGDGAYDHAIRDAVNAIRART